MVPSTRSSPEVQVGSLGWDPNGRRKDRNLGFLSDDPGHKSLETWPRRRDPHKETCLTFRHYVCRSEGWRLDKRPEGPWVRRKSLSVYGWRVRTDPEEGLVPVKRVGIRVPCQQTFPTRDSSNYKRDHKGGCKFPPTSTTPCLGSTFPFLTPSLKLTTKGGSLCIKSPSRPVPCRQTIETEWMRRLHLFGGTQLGSDLTQVVDKEHSIGTHHNEQKTGPPS